MSDLFFSTWPALARIVVLGVTGYAGLLLLLRVSGKRSASKLNMFDWVVTVALGSMLATLVVSGSTPLVHGLVAFATLIGLQYAVARLSHRFRGLNHLVRGEPTLLYYRGEFLEEPMRRERIVEEEIRAAVRLAGLGSMRQVKAVVLETSADLAIVREDVDFEQSDVFEDIDVP